MKKLIPGMLVCVALAALLIGCNQSSNTEPAPPAAPDTNAPAAPAE